MMFQSESLNGLVFDTLPERMDGLVCVFHACMGGTHCTCWKHSTHALSLAVQHLQLMAS